MKAVIGLSGSEDSGKTTTLVLLAKKLASDGKTPTVIKNIEDAIDSYANPDIEIVIPYRGMNIYLASRADNLEGIECDIAFFEQKDEGWDDIWILTENSISRLDKKFLKKYPPDICVAACRSRGITCSKLREFTLRAKPHYPIELIVRKNNITEDPNLIAEYLKTIISNL